MHLAKAGFRLLVSVSSATALTCALWGGAHADRVPLLGSSTRAFEGPSSAHSAAGLIVPVLPDSVPCGESVTFFDVLGGATPGTNYDDIVWSGGIVFAECFAGQTVGSSADFDVVSGSPTSPLEPRVGVPGQNLDVFDYSTNVLAGLGPLGYPDLDAIGEGAFSMYFPAPQSRLSLQIVGGNGGSATLDFYRADGTLIDTVSLSGLGELVYGFATANGESSITGIVIQNTDPSGIGVDNICFDLGNVSSRQATWGSLKSRYR